MSTITTINSTDTITSSRAVINTNFSNLNTDKAELAGPTFTGSPTLSTAAATSLGVGKSNSASIRVEVKADSIFTQGIRIEGDVSTRLGLSSFVTSDAQVRFTFRTDGLLGWGDGTSVTDTNLYRSAADTLKTDDSLVVVGSLGVTGTRVVKGWFTDIESTNTPTVGGTALPTASSTTTLTNKRVTKRTGTTTSSATPTINTDNVDFYSLTAQTVDITSFTTNLSGTPTEGQTLWLAITGTAARAITWGTSFESSTVTLPTTTVTTARLDVGFVWNTVTNKWRCVATA